MDTKTTLGAYFFICMFSFSSLTSSAAGVESCYQTTVYLLIIETFTILLDSAVKLSTIEPDNRLMFHYQSPTELLNFFFTFFASLFSFSISFVCLLHPAIHFLNKTRTGKSRAITTSFFFVFLLCHQDHDSMLLRLLLKLLSSVRNKKSRKRKKLADVFVLVDDDSVAIAWYHTMRVKSL